MRAIDPKIMTELEAAAFRRLAQHLRERTDVQNIDLMTLAAALPEASLAGNEGRIRESKTRRALAVALE